MNDVKYTDAISEAAYKTAVRNVKNTNSSKAWYEENEEVYIRTDASSIWRDYKYVPEKPFEGLEKYVKEDNGQQVTIYRLFEKLKLTKIPGSLSRFESPDFYNIIIKPEYRVRLYDGDMEEIPFGLGRWTFDPNGGGLTFLDGFPLGFNDKNLYVSFYRYEGRNLLESTIDTNGTVGMIPTYNPTKEQDVATKKYVDSKITATDEVVNKMKPPVPQSLDGLTLMLNCPEKFEATDIMTGDVSKTVVLPDTKFEISTPKFYNPQRGVLKFIINGTTYAEWQVGEDPLEDKDLIQIEFDDDYYINTLSSRGWYRGLKLKFSGSTEDLGLFWQQKNKYDFQVIFSYDGKDYKSLVAHLDVEPIQEKDAIKDSYFRMNPVSQFNWKYISGVPTPEANSFVKLSDFINKSAKRFTKGTPVNEYTFLDNKVESYVTVPGKYFQEVNCSGVHQIPDKFYTEHLTLEEKSFNIFGEVNGSKTETFNCRVDTISDESNRVVSGIEQKDTIVGAGIPWNSETDLTNTNELQLLAGYYTWPNGDYTKNGTSDITRQFDGSWIKKGPNYDKVKKEGTRYATFTYEFKSATGVYITIPEISCLKDLNNFDLDSVRICVQGVTGWLDCSKPYDGYGVVRKDGEGCLVASHSDNHTIYCTFGPKAISGKLFVRLGKTKEQPSFTEPQIMFNL